MSTSLAPRRSVVASALFEVFDPLPFGCFAAALVFDVIYARSGEILWMKAAAWLIVFGLLSAIVPRLINLVRVWGPRHRSSSAERVDFVLNLIAIVAAIVNAFVHSRDAYAVVPAGQWLSIVTVAAIAIGRIVTASHNARFGGPARG